MKEEKKFEFLDITTADAAFRAYGSSLNELFANAALAMFEVMIDTKQVNPKIKKEIEVKGEDLNSLMFDWLNELIFYVDAENLAFSKFDVKVDEKELKLQAVCTGEKIDPERHETRAVLKSATYHKMEIEKVKDMWRAQVILDV